MDRLSGKIALITGTASGQGRAAALLFASEGAKVVGCDLDPIGAQQTSQMVTSAGGNMVSMAPVDVSSVDEVTRWVEAAAAAFGGVDILYNNAAKALQGPIESLPIDAWRFTLSNDLDPVFLVTRAVWPHLVARGGGSIINTASIMAGRAEDLPMGAHGAAKAGVIALTVHLAVEGGPFGIRANAISPGLIETSATADKLKDRSHPIYKHVRTSPLGRVGQPEDVAPVALFLASEDSRFVTGANIVVDGGQTITLGMQFESGEA
jgi:meso-butanediol dehydrogenase/(S,S)-butanediol dehydrogenase/diacetyl reductase